MCHSRLFGLGILNYVNGFLKDDSFGPQLNLWKCFSGENSFDVTVDDFDASKCLKQENYAAALKILIV